MSEIDVIYHSWVGLFNDLPCYLIEESTSSFGGCEPNTLIIGGGSGEHPALVLEDNNNLALNYLDSFIEYQVEVSKRQPTQLKLAEDYHKLFRDFLDSEKYNSKDSYELIYFDNWTLGTFHSFVEDLKKVNNPFDYVRHEDIIGESLGELLIFSTLKEKLLDQPIIQFLDFIQGIPEFPLYPMYRNITILPPGYEAMGGNIKNEKGFTDWTKSRYAY